ncbi:MAG TPA: hypothetical protein VJ892_02970, partial [Candidatus Absconditabacterales bacterium]|nr:hypothetical protein [Candidatus Absconditabacterales bacterium]
MKKSLSILLSFFILLSSFPIGVFGEDLDLNIEASSNIEPELEDNYGENFEDGEDTTESSTQESEVQDLDDIGEENTEENTEETMIDQQENTEEELVSDDVITNGGQSGQVLDEVFVLDSNGENELLNTGVSLDDGQSGQVLEDTNILPKEDDELSFGGEILETRSGNPDPELIISEVFFDGSNEWIEIYNKGNLFSGDIIISGASANNKTVNNLIINSLETKIFTDTSVDSILDTSYVFETDMGFSISDSQDMNIELIYSGQVLDSFVLDSSTVSSIANGISFHKYKDTNNIIESDSFHNFNTTTGILANPGQVYDEILPPSDPELIITEVYFDGDEEWFEITNIATQEFSGDFSINGNLNLNISSNIPAGISKVFANNLYSMFQTG